MYIDAAIEPEQLAHVRETIQAHGARFRKIRPEPEDHWWMIILPEGTTKVGTTPRVVSTWPRTEVSRYDVLFPDGYRLLYEAGVKDRRGLFTTDPVIFLDQP
jgi:hypothetical protein